MNGLAPKADSAVGIQTDVLVVGGGIAGASAAYFLAQRHRVVLIERETGYGYHSTGRSAAEWTAAHFDGLMHSVVRFGEPFFVNPPDGFAAHALMRRRGNIMFSIPGQEESGEAFYREVTRLSPQVREMSADEALARVPFLRREVLARCYYDPDNGDIDVDLLHQGYLRGFRQRGGTTLSGQELWGAERAGDHWRVRVGEHSIEARLIVNASGAWADVIAERCGVTPLGVQPRRRTALRFDPGMDVRTVPPVDDIASGFYFKGDAAALMVCSGDATPSPPCDAQPEEIDIATAADFFERYTTLEIKKIIGRWAGLRTFVADEHPVAGFALDEPHFFWIAGQGGAGIMTSPALGELTALLVDGAELPTRAQELGLSAEALSPARLRPQRHGA